MALRPSQSTKVDQRIPVGARGHLTYVEYCRVYVDNGTVKYQASSDEASTLNQWAYAIPSANTTAVLLGPGTSITNAAARLLAQQHTMFGFAGQEMTSFASASMPEFVCPMSEYRPTQYAQHWMQNWFSDEWRLGIAKRFALARVDFMESSWKKNSGIISVASDSAPTQRAAAVFRAAIDNCNNTQSLLGVEGQFTKSIYRAAAQGTRFNRSDEALTENQHITSANYFAYSFAAVALWALGIPYSLPVLHGKTRRGGLVFDLADVIKTGAMLPLSFEQHASAKEFRAQALQTLKKDKAMKVLFALLKDICESQ